MATPASVEHFQFHAPVVAEDLPGLISQHGGRANGTGRGGNRVVIGWEQIETQKGATLMAAEHANIQTPFLASIPNLGPHILTGTIETQI